MMPIHNIKLKNILSFGPDVQELELKPLNVLIGPNGSGKSNFIQVFSLLQAAPHDIAALMREEGGASNWAWHGEQAGHQGQIEVDVEVPSIFLKSETPFCYSLTFDSASSGLEILQEQIEQLESGKAANGNSTRYMKRQGRHVLLACRDQNERIYERELPPESILTDKSILSQIRDPVQYPELAGIGTVLSNIQFHRHWIFGRGNPTRSQQRADLPNFFVEEGGRNLGMVLNYIQGRPELKRKFIETLQELYNGINDYHVNISGGNVEIFLKEDDDFIPAARLSDGALRYLYLLAILCSKRRQPMICIEEPELGLHPDILPGLAGLLREASEQCQIVVTTHSDVLVDSLTDTPESVVICEKADRQTKLKRLDKNELSRWLDNYRLGELWISGELGGNRW